MVSTALVNRSGIQFHKPGRLNLVVILYIGSGSLNYTGDIDFSLDTAIAEQVLTCYMCLPHWLQTGGMAQ